MRQFILTLALAALLPLSAPAQDTQPAPDAPALPEGRPLLPFLEDWTARTEEMMRELMEEVGPDMERMMAEIMPRLQELAQTLGGLSNYEMPEVLPNGDIIIRRKPDAPPLPEDFLENREAPIEL